MPRIANDVSPNLAKRIERETQRCTAPGGEGESGNWREGWADGDVRCFGEIGDVGQPLIHRHIERTIKLETRVDEFRGRARLNPISAVGGPNGDATVRYISLCPCIFYTG